MISAEVVQEIQHRFTALGPAQDGRAAMAAAALDLFAPVLPVTHTVMRRMVELVERYASVQGRDLIHAATCLEEGIRTIVSPDTHFDAVDEIERVALDAPA